MRPDDKTSQKLEGLEHNSSLLMQQKEKIDDLERQKVKLEKEKDTLEEKIRHSASLPICWNPYDSDKNGGNIRHMNCGHTVCSQCLDKLKGNKTHIKCPTCTEPCHVSKIRSIRF